MSHPITPPDQDEYAPFYAGYVGRVAGRDLRGILERQVGEIRALIAPLTDDDGRARYEPDRWSVKEVLGHIADTERVMSYRLLRIARGDITPLPGFEQDAYAAAANADERTLESLVAELEAVRGSTLALAGSLGEDAWERRGVASGREVSARALAHIIAGHLDHHVVILRERYGLG